jgi:hypothetical protein
MTGAPRDSTTKRYPRAKQPRAQSLLAGPLREVVHIFDREGRRGGGYWMLVLDCGHAVARKRVPLTVGTLFRPLAEKLAPKRCQCHYCGTGASRQDPRIMIKALGGEVS